MSATATSSSDLPPPRSSSTLRAKADELLAKADIFDCTEAFYNRTRRHSHLCEVSPEAFERASA